MKKSQIDKLKSALEEDIYMAVKGQEWRVVRASTARGLATQLEQVMELSPRSATSAARALYDGAKRIQLSGCSVSWIGRTEAKIDGHVWSEITRHTRPSRRARPHVERADVSVSSKTSEQVDTQDTDAPASGFLEWHDQEVSVDRPG